MGRIMIICIIPARGGSKRIPRKNIRLFAGKPVIHYSITAARASRLFDRIVVSTDCPHIAREARISGAEVPFTRPSRLADDHTGTVPVILHALKELQCEHWDVVCALYPTAPLVRPERLREALELLDRSGAPGVFPVTSFPAPVHRGFLRDEEGRVRMLWPEHMESRSNDLPDVFHDAGQFYFWDIPRFLAEPMLYPPASRGLVLPRHEVQDIDTEEDWAMAERLYAASQGLASAA